MVEMEDYSRLAWPQEKLLHKDFPHKNVFSVIASSKTDSLVNKTKVSFKKTAEDDYSRFDYVKQPFVLRAELYRASLPVFLVTYQPPSEQFKASLALDCRRAPLAQVAFQWKRPNLQASFKADTAKQLHLSTVSGTDTYGVGLDMAYCLQQLRFSKYDASAWLKRGEHRAVLSHTSSDSLQYRLGTVSFSFHYVWSNKFSIAGLLNSLYQAQVAVKVDDSMKQAKVSIKSDGDLDLSVSRKITENISFVTSSSVNLWAFSKQVDSLLHYGFAVKIY